MWPLFRCSVSPKSPWPKKRCARSSRRAGCGKKRDSPLSPQPGAQPTLSWIHSLHQCCRTTYETPGRCSPPNSLFARISVFSIMGFYVFCFVSISRCLTRPVRPWERASSISFPLCPGGSLWRASALRPGLHCRPRPGSRSYSSLRSVDKAAWAPHHTPEPPAVHRAHGCPSGLKNRLKESIGHSVSITQNTETAWNRPP